MVTFIVKNDDGGGRGYGICTKENENEAFRPKLELETISETAPKIIWVSDRTPLKREDPSVVPDGGFVELLRGAGYVVDYKGEIDSFEWDDPNDPDDPIRRMIIPSIEELNTSGQNDTSGECENTKLIGLQHKYSQTALILATNRCAAYCRYCFRKRLVGLPNKEIINKFSEAANYIKDHKEINNVLISGGDPLVLPTQLIEELLELLSQHSGTL